MGWSKNNSRQQMLPLALPLLRPNPTIDELRAAYERCVQDKQSLPFERALTIPMIALTLKNSAISAILKHGGS